MSDQEVLNRLRGIIADVLEVEEEEVRGDANFGSDLGADSLRVIEILSRMEKDFGVTIDQQNLARMVSLNSVKEVLDESMAVTAS